MLEIGNRLHSNEFLQVICWCPSGSCAPTVGSLPSFVRTADSFTSFKSQLKTYMFARHL